MRLLFMFIADNVTGFFLVLFWELEHVLVDELIDYSQSIRCWYIYGGLEVSKLCVKIEISATHVLF